MLIQQIEQAIAQKHLFVRVALQAGREAAKEGRIAPAQQEIDDIRFAYSFDFREEDFCEGLATGLFKLGVVGVKL